MKKWILCIALLSAACNLSAAQLPDNMYFRAMQDELKRTLKSLHRPGIPRPFYAAYKVEMEHAAPVVRASLGTLYPSVVNSAGLDATVILDIGSARSDSLGYAHDSYHIQYAYRPQRTFWAGQNYDALRQALWKTTDDAYVLAAETYQQKQAYKRLKELPAQLPDILPAKQAHFVEEIPAPPTYNVAELEQWAQQLSAHGQDVAFLEQYEVSFRPAFTEVYYLNSRGGFYQYARQTVQVEWTAQLRTEDGYKKTLSDSLWTSSLTPELLPQLQEKNAEFLQSVQALYHAQKGSTYVGPVLLQPAAASQFLKTVFVKNMQNIQPLLSAKHEPDATAGKFRDKLGLRVLSNVVNVYDRPHERTFQGTPLLGFTPVDDEGVLSQELTLVTGGKLRQLPRSTRPEEKGAASNGHARLSALSLPREQLTNVFVEAKHPQTPEALEQQLLEKCRTLELDYCYILPTFPSFKQGDASLTAAQRIYTSDGHKETVYGLKISDLTPRSLRDIVAAGDDARATQLSTSPYAYDMPTQSLVTPSLLLEELELVPDDKKADKQPFVPLP